MCAISDFSCKSCERHGNLIFQGPNATNSHGSPPEFPVSTCATSTAERRPPFPPAFSSLVATRGEGMEGGALSPSRRMERRERISKNSLACGAHAKMRGLNQKNKLVEVQYVSWDADDHPIAVTSKKVRGSRLYFPLGREASQVTPTKHFMENSR